MLEHDIKKANILGFSDGGNIALKFILKYPDCVDKLIPNGANLEPNGVKFRFQFPVEIAFRITKIFSGISARAKKRMELLGLMVNDPFIEIHELKNIAVPTLVIAGTNDMIHESHTKLIANSIPNSKLVFIKGDHFIANKKPEEFNLAVNNFLQGK